LQKNSSRHVDVNNMYVLKQLSISYWVDSDPWNTYREGNAT